MATYNNYKLCMIIALVFFGATTEAQVVGLNGLMVSGSLCCTPTGNCPGQGLSGVPVRLTCTFLGVSTTVGSSTTNANGRFSITIPALFGILSGLPIVPCRVSVQLPLSSSVVCPVLNTANGTLTSTVRSLGTTVNSALGSLLNVGVNGFVNTNVGV